MDNIQQEQDNSSLTKHTELEEIGGKGRKRYKQRVQHEANETNNTQSKK